MSDDDTLGFDPIDDALRSRLGRVEPTTVDPDVMLASLTPRFLRARRRHRMILAASSALAIVALIAIASVVVATGGSTGRNVQTPPANTGQTDRPVTTTTNTPAATTAAPQPTGTPVTRTFDSDGGSVTVRVENGALSIVSTARAPGFAEERHDSGPVRVEVRFTNTQSDEEWRIRVELVNGEPIPEITEN